MKAKLRFLGICLCIHLVASGVVWGGLCVSQRGYNTMHREQIAIASVSVTEEKAHIQLLQQNCEIPAFWNDEDDPFYYALYALSDESMHSFFNLLSLAKEIKNQ
ncbi:MAG: hypothetical protein E7504_04960 [Ruminococcus sp.]|nr:hypothetical protein [Ruminococcus sp.]